MSRQLDDEHPNFWIAQSGTYPILIGKLIRTLQGALHRRGLAGEDAVPAAEKVRFLAQDSDVVERCQTGTNMEIHKSEVAMLYDVEPHGNGRGVVVANLRSMVSIAD